MTVTYSLDVANTRFLGFTKLLLRWKGSIYKILYKEFIVFVTAYAALTLIYRLLLNEYQKRHFEDVVIYCEAFIDFIPLSFVLGFYVSLVVGRWWQQFDAIPWGDRISYMIGCYVHGSDERSRMIRRTMVRYLILLQAITFQSVSTAVKKRFPTSQHLVWAGLMTKEERTIYEKLEAPYGKWWLPAQWWSALAMRAKKEGRIKDSILLDGLFREFLNFRSACGTMFNYDWISVPLVYTQVVTLATYTYSLALLIGRQYLDPSTRYENHRVDPYVPFFTILQFFFYVGWLKVAEQIVNPYGEDDDDFELSWCIDRNCHILYLIVDHFQTKHPKLRKDAFWDLTLPQLPQTKITKEHITNPQLGSAFNLEVHPADAEFLPMDTVMEEESDAHVYSSDSVKQSAGVRYRPSFLMNILNSNFGQSMRRRSTRKSSTLRDLQGHVNPVFAAGEKLPPPRVSTPTQSRKHSLAKKSSPTHSRASSASIHPGSISRLRQKMLDTQQAEANSLANGGVTDGNGQGICPTLPAGMSTLAAHFEDPKPRTESDPPKMPSIPEEPSRCGTKTPGADACCIKPMDDVQNLVAEASKVLEELNKAVTTRGHKNDCESKGYESCCSLDSDDASSSDEDNFQNPTDSQNDSIDKDSVIVDVL